jgi:hypothetical protein
MASDQPAIPVTLGDEPFNNSVDAAGRLRVAEPFTMFDHYFTQDDGGLFWDTDLTGGATITRLPTESAMRLRVETANGDKAIHQTKPYFPHQAGKAHQIAMTGVLGATKADVRKRIGYFDANDGLFFEDDGTGLFVVRRTSTSGSPVDNRVAQASWNIDTLDGLGDSEITLDISKMQLFYIDFEWLGAGRVRMGFVVDGVVHYCHQFSTANVLVDAFMASPNLPLRFEIENTAAQAGNTDFIQVCSTVVSEGGWNPLGIRRAVDTGSSTIAVSTPTPILNLRLKSANNRAIVKPTGVSAGTTNGKDIIWRLIIGGSLTGASWSSVSSTAFTEVDISSTAITGGEVVATGFSTADSSSFTLDIDSSIWLVSDFAGTSDILSLEIARVGTGSAHTVASMSFKEFL